MICLAVGELKSILDFLGGARPTTVIDRRRGRRAESAASKSRHGNPPSSMIPHKIPAARRTTSPELVARRLIRISIRGKFGDDRPARQAAAFRAATNIALRHA